MGERQRYVAVALGGSEATTHLGRLDAIIEATGASKQISDLSAIEKIVDEVLAANAKSVEEFRAGKDKAFNALVGQAMKATHGKANPQQVNEILRAARGCAKSPPVLRARRPLRRERA